MPESLLTTKRMFYKFLDQLSAPSSASKPKRPLSTLNPTPTNNAFNTPTTSNIESRLPKRLRPSTSSTSLASFRSRLSAASTPTSSKRRRLDTAPAPNAPATKEPELPSFCPWSQAGFLARLKTFAPVTSWMPKPDDAVGEVAWAKRGWSVVGVETVGCKACRARVVVDFRPSERGKGEEFGSARVQVAEGTEEEEVVVVEGEEDEGEWEEAFERGLVERYSALVMEGHEEGCSWRQAGCKDDIYRLPVVRSLWWQREVKGAYAAALGMREDVEKLKIKEVLEVKPSVERMLGDLPKSFFASSSQDGEAEEDSALRSKALILALLGWTATIESSTNLLTCKACFQRIGLWMYTSRSTATTNSAEGDDGTALNLIEQHREHCPYRNGDMQCATGDYKGWPAWKIQWDVCGRYADEQRRRSRDRYLPSSLAVEDDSATEPVDATSGTEGVENGHDEAGREETPAEATTEASEEQPELKDWQRREIVAKLDKERTNKLRKLKRVLGFKFRMPPGVGEKRSGDVAVVPTVVAPEEAA